MKRTKVILWMMMVVNTILAQQADYAKMSPFVQQVATQHSKATSKRVSGNPFTTSPSFLAFVQTDGNDADNVLSIFGCKKYAQLDDISIAAIPLYNLSALSRHPAVRRIEANQMAQPTTDTIPSIVWPSMRVRDFHRLSRVKAW